MIFNHHHTSRTVINRKHCAARRKSRVDLCCQGSISRYHSTFNQNANFNLYTQTRSSLSCLLHYSYTCYVPYVLPLHSFLSLLHLLPFLLLPPPLLLPLLLLLFYSFIFSLSFPSPPLFLPSLPPIINTPYTNSTTPPPQPPTNPPL